MRCSLKQFALTYLQELTGLKTTSIKLFFSSLEQNPRAKEALFVFALASKREEYLLRLSSHTAFEESYYREYDAFKRARCSLPEWLESLPNTNRYRKVWNAWQSSSTQLQRDRNMMQNVRDAIERELMRRGIKRAYICKQLRINKGNFYAFMKGDMSKMSREKAIAAYDALLQM